jgi:hypothetical protein
LNISQSDGSGRIAGSELRGARKRFLGIRWLRIAQLGLAQQVYQGRIVGRFLDLIFEPLNRRGRLPALEVKVGKRF